MSASNDETQETDVPQQALQALKAAQVRSVQAGHPQVLVLNGQLVRITPAGTEVLKQMAARRVVSVRRKSVAP